MLVRLFVFIIGLYQKFISPLLPPSCRYYPSCSEYTKQALQIHGFFKGSYLGAKRILRCHPLYPGGYDPVPPPKSRKAKSGNG